MKVRPTIKDVALKANVAVGTVSNVLNGTREVSESRRKRVLEAIEDLGFKQNMLAHGLRRNTLSIIGLCVPHTSTSYFAALVDAFEEFASSRSFAVMQVLTHQDPVAELQRVEQLLRYRVSGILLIPSASPEASFDVIAKGGVPVVAVDRPAPSKAFDQVIFANRQAMYEVGSRIIALGHRRILFCVQHPHLSVTVERREGLNRAISEAPKPVTADLLICADTEEGFAKQIRLALDEPQRPTAIIVSNSMLAEWIVRGLQGLGVRYPEEVSVLAFGEPHWSDLVTPKLSVVRQPIREIAVSAWELLLKRINGEKTKPRRLEIEGSLVMRESVGAPPTGAPPPRRRKLV